MLKLVPMSATIDHLEQHRAALTGHCYRMLGSVVDADEAVRDTMMRAWHGFEHFDKRASLRNWLLRIATNVCLDTLTEKMPRTRPEENTPSGLIGHQLIKHPPQHWVEPIADTAILPCDVDPGERTILRQSTTLPYIAALQHLLPQQRAILLLADVQGFAVAEIAETLGIDTESIGHKLERARSTMAARNIRPFEPMNHMQTELLEQFVDAFQRYDVPSLVSLLDEEATFSMPPYDFWLEGTAAIRDWLEGPGYACRGSRLLPTTACGSPAFGQYRPIEEDGHMPWALVVLELRGDRIIGWNAFLDTERLFPFFGLPEALLHRRPRPQWTPKPALAMGSLEVLHTR